MPGNVIGLGTLPGSPAIGTVARDSTDGDRLKVFDRFEWRYVAGEQQSVYTLIDMAGGNPSGQMILPFPYCYILSAVVWHPYRAWVGSPTLGLGTSFGATDLATAAALAPLNATTKALVLPLVSPTRELSESVPLYWSIGANDSGSPGAYVLLNVLLANLPVPPS